MDNYINNLSIVGTGPSDASYIYPLAYNEIESADIIAGAGRIIDKFNFLNKETIVYNLNFACWINEIKKSIKNKKVVVLVSGDPGFYSLSRRIIECFKPDVPKIMPGISSIQIACAMAGRSWNNSEIFSIHGRETDVCEILKNREEFFLLIDQNFNSKNIGKCLADLNQSERIINVFSDLGSSSEKFLKFSAKDIIGKILSPNSILLFEKFDPDKKNFYGIGVGIGGFDMLTLKAVRVLKNVDKIYTPKAKISSDSIALRSVKSFLGSNAEIIELEFNMSRDADLKSEYYRTLSENIAAEIKKGIKVAFITIGDPLIYSTYNYLLKNLKKKISPKLIETIPGISSYTYAMSRINKIIIEGNEKMAVLPCKGDMGDYPQFLKDFDTLIFMKIGKNLKEIIQLIEESGRKSEALFFKNMGCENEISGISLNEIDENESGYFSVIIVRR
ncbi:MAG: precorrin-2 C(20)-methyltransferase [Candidatus Humimicrobiaceae bacterium]